MLHKSSALRHVIKHLWTGGEVWRVKTRNNIGDVDHRTHHAHTQAETALSPNRGERKPTNGSIRYQ